MLQQPYAVLVFVIPHLDRMRRNHVHDRFKAGDYRLTPKDRFSVCLTALKIL